MASDPLLSRRRFLKTGAAAVVGAALPTSAAPIGSPEERSQARTKLVYRTLGRTGLRLPIVSMGSCYSIDLVRVGLERGLVYIHTSSGYAEGQHERLLGKAVRGLPRDSFVVATNPDLPYKFEGNAPSLDVGREADPRRIITSLDESLRNLGLDHVDIYYLASVGKRGSVLHEPYIEAFDRLKRQGKTRFVGITTHANEPAVIRAAVESGFWDVVLTAYNFKQTHRSQVRDAIEAAAGAGLGVVAMKTQAGVYWDRARRSKINMKAALKWALANENVHTAIPAFSNFEELEEDLAVAADPVLTEEEKRDLEPGDDLGFSGYYCEQCGECLAQCPHGVDVPTLMRSYMYLYGHGQPRMARHTLRSWKLGDVACTVCGACRVACRVGFDVRARAINVARILDVPDEFVGRG